MLDGMFTILIGFNRFIAWGLLSIGLAPVILLAIDGLWQHWESYRYGSEAYMWSLSEDIDENTTKSYPYKTHTLSPRHNPYGPALALAGVCLVVVGFTFSLPKVEAEFHEKETLRTVENRIAQFLKDSDPNGSISFSAPDDMAATPYIYMARIENQLQLGVIFSSKISTSDVDYHALFESLGLRASRDYTAPDGTRVVDIEVPSENSEIREICMTLLTRLCNYQAGDPIEVTADHK